LGYSADETKALIYNRTGQYFRQGVHQVDPFDLI
jgi:hypothetical protein